ncbi:hypothetical protein SEA_JACKO_18 [Microbacterium phage Jacko]|nr:hypothetical protein SEA_JACKO_18 [Microbacterium phage Jacko]
MTERIEWRARYRIPSSILSSAEDRARGYEELFTGYCETREEARKVAMHRSEETLASVIGYQKRTVVVGEWEDWEEPKAPTPKPPPHRRLNVSFGGALCMDCPVDENGLLADWRGPHSDLPDEA